MYQVLHVKDQVYPTSHSLFFTELLEFTCLMEVQGAKHEKSELGSEVHVYGRTHLFDAKLRNVAHNRLKMI